MFPNYAAYPDILVYLIVDMKHKEKEYWFILTDLKPIDPKNTITPLMKKAIESFVSNP